MSNMLTTKEIMLVSDLLTYEENICKKAKLYSRILTDKILAEKVDKIAEIHRQNFQELFKLL